MTPTRILPDLQAALLCEDVRQEVTGNIILLGVTRLLRVPQMPITAHKLCVFTTWTAGVGEFVECVRLIAPDQTTVIRKAETRFALREAYHSTANVSFFMQLEFKTDGVYYIEVIVDDVMKLRFPLPVLVVQPPQQPQGQQPAGPAAPQGQG